ncbi:hypothetical protein CN895_07840 [Bacillus cereus]|uniref:hypothetical protein n=1 Tax=Bacillus cereus TaxID=1396 RepID=UPI000BFC2532|nr:hypothetical protein [Bacillus cereus]PGK15251.1 hypothetical protein CN895_07840 [Bacillus cereus]
MGIKIAESNEVTKKKYRLGYDYLFLPRESISYKNDLIRDMAITVLFKLHDDNGNEKLFESEELEDQSIVLKNGEHYYLSDFINCVFHREKMFEFEPNLQLIKYLQGSLSWEIVRYEKGIGKGIVEPVEPVEISKEEFMDIMGNHLDLFDVSDNYPTQTTSYITREVK